jgi:hypothetical protein
METVLASAAAVLLVGLAQAGRAHGHRGGKARVGSARFVPSHALT